MQREKQDPLTMTGHQVGKNDKPLSIILNNTNHA